MGSLGDALGVSHSMHEEEDESFAMQRKAAARSQRDLYLEMMRLENPDFSFIPIQDLRSAFHTSPPPNNPKISRQAYNCSTQQNETLEELFLGVNRGDLHLWESGSVINWIARSDGYRTRQEGMDAAVALFRATQLWNEALDGRVKFRYVTRFDDAAFQVVYGGNRGGVLASAFFPDQWEMSLNTLHINQTQFSPSFKPVMVNTMLHELGHVLGLRHEHSHSGVPGWLPPEDTANGAESILWGVRNPKSVMAYYHGQTIQDSDVTAIRSAYDELDDGKVISGKGRFGTVRKIVKRVQPNN